jgi:hypothetical protein
METKPAAIGCRAHSGWAARVIVAGSVDAPTILGRRRIVIADPKIAGSKQPYHAAEGLPFPRAEQLVARCTERSRLMARQALQAALEEACAEGYEVRGCGVVLASGRPLPDLAATLASHALIRTAEGELFRNVIADASRAMKVPVTGVKERELLAQASAALGLSDAKLQSYLRRIGRDLGPPWTQDEKSATLVAWLALAGARPRAWSAPR